MQERSNGGVRPEAVLAVLLIISVLLIIFTKTDWSSRKLGSRVLLSLQSLVGQAGDRIQDGFALLKRSREIRANYEAALEKLGDYQGLERDIVELRRENEALRKELGYSSSIEYRHLSARIVAGDPSNLHDTFTIDLGSSGGVQGGMVVTAFQNGFLGLVGKVVTVASSASQVRPILDPDHYVAARLQKTRYEGLVEGRGDGKNLLLMRFVQKAARNSIAVNDLVVTSGMQSLYPAGITIGRVREVRSQEYATSLELILTPVIDIARMEYVFVLESLP